MDLLNHRVEYFISTSRFKTLSEGARRMGVTQAALSTSIKQLEEEIGIKLFHRAKAGITLTDGGRELLSILGEQKRVLESRVRGSVSSSEGGKAMMLRIGSVGYYGERRILPLLKKHKGLFQPLQGLLGFSYDVYSAVRDSKLDLGFISWTSRPTGVGWIEIDADPVKIMGLRSQFPEIEKIKDLSELEGYPWIYLPKPQYDWTDVIGMHENCFIARDVAAVQHLLLKGYGLCEIQVGVIPDREMKKIAISKVPSKYPNTKIYMIYEKTKAKILSKHIEFFLKHLMS